MADETKRVAYAILDFLNEEFRKPTTTSDSRESLEVAQQCLETAFGVTLNDTSLKSSKSLREIFRAGTSSGSPSSRPSMTDMFPDFSAIARAAAGTNTAAGGPRERRPLTAIDLDLGPDYHDVGPVPAESKRLGDEFKNTGNEYMRDAMYAEALTAYSKAIELDPGNAVYFCNRAAAYLKLENFDKALRDVQIALQLQPGYARAFARMGVIYSSMGKSREAYSCYLQAVELEPANESYVSNLRLVTETLESGDAGDPAAGPGAGFFSEVFQNPQLISMASQMLQDPNMQSMMRNIVSNLQGAGGGNPDEQPQSLDELLQMGSAIASRIRLPDGSDGDGAGGGGGEDQGPGSTPRGGGGGYNL